MSDDLKNRFEHHPPKDEETAKAHEEVRLRLLGAAKYLDRIVPDGREKALAFTKLEEAMFWANAGIARAD